MAFSTERPHYWLFAVLALGGLIADQTSKYVVFAQLYPADHEHVSRVEVLPGCFALQTMYMDKDFPTDSPLYVLQTLSGPRIPHVNRGALFGIGNATDLNFLFAGISVLAGGFVLGWAYRPNVAKDRFLSIALGLILAGTLGNLYDRIVFSGVRDFLHCYYDTHIWPDFNIADCCLVCGAGVLLVHSFLVSEKSAKSEPAQTAEAAVPMQTTSPANGV